MVPNSAPVPRRDLAALFVIALAFNLALAAFVAEPGYVDDAYYYGGALRLAGGYGFTEPYLWNYLGNPPAIPQPSHLYWMPLTSIVSAGAMAVFGQSFNAARLPFVLLGSLLPLVSYAVAWRNTGLRRHAMCAALLTIFCGYYAAYWGTTDSFALYGLIGSLTLFGVSAGRDDWRLALGIGLGCGLAHLTRADGVLLLAVAWWSCVFSGRRPAVARNVALTTTGYLIVMLPWFLRNTLAVGNPLGGGGAAALWLIEYNDLFNHPSNLSLARYLAAGWPTILLTKWDALLINLQHIIGEQGLVFFAPFIAIGLWRQRAQNQAVLVYAALLYLAMTFAFTFPGARGGLFHSGVALLPFYFSAGLTGFDSVIDWAAARLKHWQPEKAKVNFSGLAVIGALSLTLAISLPRVTSWNGAGDLFRELVAGIPKGAVVMSNNPPGLWAAAGHPGLPLVNGEVPDLLAVADQYGAAYVLLDHNVPRGLETLYLSGHGQRLTLIKTYNEWKLFEVQP